MQSEYSLIVRNPEIAVMEACRELGTTLVAFSPVGRGMFSQVPLDPAEYWEGDMRRGFFPRLAEPHFSENQKLLPMALRPVSGLDLQRFEALFGQGPDPKLVAELARNDLAHINENRLILTAQGRLMADYISGRLAPY